MCFPAVVSALKLSIPSRWLTEEFVTLERKHNWSQNNKTEKRTFTKSEVGENRILWDGN